MTGYNGKVKHQHNSCITLSVFTVKMLKFIKFNAKLMRLKQCFNVDDVMQLSVKLCLPVFSEETPSLSSVREDAILVVAIPLLWRVPAISQLHWRVAAIPQFHWNVAVTALLWSLAATSQVLQHWYDEHCSPSQWFQIVVAHLAGFDHGSGHQSQYCMIHFQSPYFHIQRGLVLMLAKQEKT